MFYSLENDDQNNQDYDPYNNLSSSTSVDCTLSLGTPSTRLDDHRRFSSASSINISGDYFYHEGNAKTTSYKKGGGDHNLPRRCASCDTTSTPLWRNGPKGPKSLCNACGIRFKKEERRATARNSITSGGSPAAEIPAGENYYSHHNHYASSPSWAQQNTQRVQYFSPAREMEYPFVDDATAASFMSWN
ncbi:unnamed protein product [Eruca vesicaria subsp. sativa]|uniref:GATA-type domain-containing protein n=1 Tax=Eruca vesicaria subsp. sativa TaxID=29727 RepID=A0ABC8LE18_ERUVS|nr:unnamed protein product [Eruca vesicaria subsp. sativa]